MTIRLIALWPADTYRELAAERRLGRVPVLLVRINAELVMGEELKKTGAGNLFTVFGESDIEINAEGDDLRVVLHGVDVHDPNESGKIAVKVIDDYGDEGMKVFEVPA